MAIEDKLNYLLDTKKQIKNSITEKGVDILETDTFRSYADKIKQIKGSSETDEWKPEPDWYDIEEILNNDTTQCYAKAIALLRDDIESGLTYNQVRGAEHYNINGEIFIEANPDEVVVIKDYLKNIQGKPCSKGYNTKYIIYYIDRPQTPIMIPNSGIYFIIKDCNATNPNAFYGKNIEAIKFINSKILNADYQTELFWNNYSLESIEGLNIKNRTTEAQTFQNCMLLRKAPQMDTSNVTNMYMMFDGCYSLKNVPEMDTSNVTNMTYMFGNCLALQRVSTIDGKKATNMYRMFNSCYSLINIDNISNIKSDIYLANSGYLNHTTLIKVLNALVATTTTETLTLGSTNLSKLTDEEKAIATEKGWTLA